MYIFYYTKVTTAQFLLVFILAVTFGSPVVPEYGIQYINASLEYPGAQPRSLRFQPESPVKSTDHALIRNSRSHQSSNILKRQLPVPLTPVIDASRPHTDLCTLDICRAKCIVRDMETCIPQCVNYACYCKCPNPDKPSENVTPFPPVQLVPDIQYETPSDYIRPPISPPLDDMNSPLRYPGLYNQYRPGYPPSPYGYGYPVNNKYGYGQVQGQGQGIQYGNAYGSSN